GPNAWYLAHAIDELRFDIVARYGTAAATLLTDVVAKGGASGVDKLRSIAEALALIVTRDVADVFTPQLGTKELRAIAAAYLQSHPEVSVVPLAMASTGKGPLAEAAKAVLKPIVASSNDAVATASASLPPAAQNLIAELREQTQAREEAPPDEV